MKVTILLLSVLISTASVFAHSGDLRGVILGQVNNGYGFMNVPRIGAQVTLAAFTPNGLMPISQSMTNGNGFYFFPGVPPGNYMLLVGPMQFPIQVFPTQFQDIPPVTLNW